MRGKVLALLLIAGIAAAGCGKKSQSEAFVARAKQLCASILYDDRAEGPVEERRELRNLIRSNEKLDVVRRWESYALARRKLYGTFSKALEDLFAHPNDPQAFAHYTAVYKRDLKLQEDERALGLRYSSCVGNRRLNPSEVQHRGLVARSQAAHG